MARFLPPHPKKGSVEAKLWAQRMQAARKKKRATRNPGEREHMELARAAHAQVQGAQYPEEKAMYKGMEMAHRDSAAIERLRKKRGISRNPRMPLNIEKSGFRRGQYVGYGNGVWRIFKYGSGPTLWAAVREKPKRGYMTAGSLEEMSEKLTREAEIKDNPIAVYGIGNPPKYSAVCTANGCIFLREHLTKKQANLEATSHMRMTGHGVSIVPQTPAKNPRRKRKSSVTRRYSLCCTAQGCMWKKEEDSPQSANRSACAHANANGHKVRVSPTAYKHNPGALTKISANVVGVVYNRVREVRAEKTVYRPGLYKHPFKKGVQQLALDNGDLLLHSTTGKPLWDRA